MPRKPVIQTMVATSLALSGTASARTVGIDDLGASGDLIETSYFDEELFFGGDDAEYLAYDEDEHILFVQKSTDKGSRTAPRKAPPAARKAPVAKDTPAVKMPAARKRGETAPVITGKTPDRVGTKPPKDGGVVACCTIYGGVGKDAVFGGGIRGDTIYGGAGKDAVTGVPRAGDAPINGGGGAATPGVGNRTGGTNLRSSGGGIKLRGQ